MRRAKPKYLGQLCEKEFEDLAYELGCGEKGVFGVRFEEFTTKIGIPSFLCRYFDNFSDHAQIKEKHITDFYVTYDREGVVIDLDNSQKLREIMKKNPEFGKEYSADLEKIEEVEDAIRKGQQPKISKNNEKNK